MHLLQLIFILTTLCLQTPKDKPVLLLNGTAHLGNGQVISNAAIAVHDQKITMIADATRIRIDMSAFEVKRVQGKHIYAATLSDSAEHDQVTENPNNYVLLGAKKVIIDQSKNALKEGRTATLLVTDKPVDKATKPSISMAFIAGKEMQLSEKCENE